MLEEIANVAEIIGVTLVLITLIFLTLQIRQNTRAIRSTTIQAVMQSDMAFAQILVDHAALWDKILSGGMPEPGAETRRATIIYNLFMIETETRFHQFQLGHLGELAWQARLRTVPLMVRLPMYSVWRESLGGQSHSEDFLELLSRIHTESTEV